MRDSAVSDMHVSGSLAAPTAARAAGGDAAGVEPAGVEPAGVEPAGGATVAAVVRELAELLGARHVEDATREARDIIAAVADVPRFWPSLHATDVLGARATQRARAAAARRAAGAPFAYAVGRAAFRHLTLEVDERVLIPRQETEVLVEAVLECTAGACGVVVDVGTGSGAIALALAMEGGFDLVIGTDVALGAIDVASANARRLAPAMKTPVEFRAGALFAPVRDVRARVVVSNPPYIAYDEAATLPRSVRDWEPAVALYAASGGMAATAEIIRGAPAILESGGLLALEVDSRRAASAVEMTIADGHYSDVTVRLDLAGRERILLARRA
jgi:release factor glutamine methyltransferase